MSTCKKDEWERSEWRSGSEERGRETERETERDRDGDGVEVGERGREVGVLAGAMTMDDDVVNGR